MSVPNHAHVPKKLHETGLFNLKDHEGHHAFTDATISTLNGIDSNWRHLKKKPGQTQIGGHGEDSALYLQPDGTATAVDFIAGAGGPNPGPGWIVDTTVYKHSDAHDPDDHGIGDSTPTQPPAPVIPGYETIGGDAFFRAHVGVPLQADMAAAGQPLNDGSSVWFSRTSYDVIVGVIADPAVDTVAIAKAHRNEWRAILGQPPI